MSINRLLGVLDSIVIAGVFADSTALKAINTTDSVNYPNLCRAYIDGVGEYYLDAEDTTSTESIPTRIKPTTGGGCWKKLPLSTVTDNNLIKLLFNLVDSGGGNSATGTTSTDVETPLTTSIVDDGYSVTITGTIIGKSIENSIGGTFMAVFNRDDSADGLVQIGTTDLIIKRTSDLLFFNVDADNSTSEIRILVTGEDSINYDWKCTYSVVKI